MKIRPASGFRSAASAAAAGALILVLTASKCGQEITFPAYVAENCTDKADNDGDGKIDCEDLDCAAGCAIKVSINPIPSPIGTDSLTVTGHATNATAVAVSIVPMGLPGTAVLDTNSGAWTVKLANLSQRGQYTLTATASRGDMKDADTASFTRGQ